MAAPTALTSQSDVVVEAMHFADGVLGSAGHSVPDPAVRVLIIQIGLGEISRKEGHACIDAILEA